MLDNLIEDFLLHRESEGRSAKTLTWHRGCLRLFSKWLRENDIPTDPNTWEASTIRRYLVYLRERDSERGKPLSAYSIRCYASSVRAFCRWLKAEEITSRNAAERVSQPKTPHLVKEPFDAEDVKRLLSAAKSDRRNGLRDVALLLFMLDTGCRASETVGLRADAIVWDQRLAKVMGKGAKERIVFLSADTVRAMQRYSTRGRRGRAITFFETEEGRVLTPCGLLRITKRIAERGKVDDVHPHRFRHTFAISFLRQGGNLLALQRLLGHTTLAMTSRYVALVTDDMRREHEQFSPVAALVRGR